MKPLTTEEATPDNLKLEGIDFYHRYKEDIALFAELGFNFACRLLGLVFFLRVMMLSQMKQDSLLE
ncbi:6-phospho-beta-glucosidase [Streptococcus thermophilus]|uniref:6-phospho-beta-glucosidase n=1 Tax=Streptococcus thermophilus TaxID=1308 RepID=A0A8D6UE04_STRTR|nr:6-phospho-beta-glucosidase [Streptococcus thermophilus]CAD0152442.1 6-phospho-beta-glucosidase [Streptococcus thermophilus]